MDIFTIVSIICTVIEKINQSSSIEIEKEGNEKLPENGQGL